VTVLVSKEPKRIYQSLGSLGSTEQDRGRADKLDKVLEQRVKRLLKDLKRKGLTPEKAGKGNTETYWEMGRALHDVADNEKLLDKAELPLFWQNAKIYVPSELLYRDRGPYREHLWYCYRLGGYPKELAGKMSWGEWVTIFDSTGINQEIRFDGWFKSKLSEQQERIGRSLIRTFAPCVNAMLGNIYTPDLSETELFACYEAAWRTVAEARILKEKKGSKVVNLVERREMQASIRSNMGLLGGVMDGTLLPGEYARRILADATG
jgi:hypothetical protein